MVETQKKEKQEVIYALNVLIISRGTHYSSIYG